MSKSASHVKDDQIPELVSIRNTTRLDFESTITPTSEPRMHRTIFGSISPNKCCVVLSGLRLDRKCRTSPCTLQGSHSRFPLTVGSQESRVKKAAEISCRTICKRVCTCTCRVLYSYVCSSWMRLPRSRAGHFLQSELKS